MPAIQVVSAQQAGQPAIQVVSARQAGLLAEAFAKAGLPTVSDILPKSDMMKIAISYFQNTIYELN